MSGESTERVAPPSRPVTPDAYRDALGLFATGVTVVAACPPGTDEPRGMTANAFMSVSLDPPLVLVSVRRSARLHDVLLAAGAYGVSVLGEDLEREARRFAGIAAESAEPPAFVVRAGAPVLRDAIAWVAARITEPVAAGDHTLFLGSVLGLAAERPDEPPLLFHRSAFARAVSARPDVPFPTDEQDNQLGWWA